MNMNALMRVLIKMPKYNYIKEEIEETVHEENDNYGYLHAYVHVCMHAAFMHLHACMLHL